MSLRTAKTVKSIVALAAVCLLCATTVFAQFFSVTTAAGNFIVSGGNPQIMTSPAFGSGGGLRFVAHFAAECAVNAPAGNTTAWTDVDIRILNSLGAVVATLAPTAGNTDSFCSSDGSAGLSGWSSNSVIAVSPVLPVGTFRVAVFARLNNGATQASFGERTLLLTK